MVDIDATDKVILNPLWMDARMSNVDLAAQVHLSPSACLRRVRRLEENGVIGAPFRDSAAVAQNPPAHAGGFGSWAQLDLNQ